MERKPFPSETQERFIVRLPDGMRDRIAEAAKANNRSMNAEVVSRLQESLEPQGATVHMAAPLVYLLLDSHGYPISWEEMRTTWRALIQEEGLDYVSLDVQVITPDMESSSRRATDAVALAKKLRAGGKSKLLPKGNE